MALKETMETLVIQKVSIVLPLYMEDHDIKDKILKGAEELFMKYGARSISMDDIARHLSVSKKTLYQHFADKDTLISELCRHDFREFATHFARAAAFEDPVERLRASGRAYFEFASEFPQHYRLMFMAARPEVMPEDGEENDPAQNAYVFLHATVEDAIEKGLFRPEISDAGLASQTIWAATHGVASLEIAFGHQKGWVQWLPLERRQEMLIDSILRGMLRDPDKYLGKGG